MAALTSELGERKERKWYEGREGTKGGDKLFPLM